MFDFSYHFNDIFAYSVLKNSQSKVNDLLEVKIYLVAVDTNLDLHALIDKKEYHNKVYIDFTREIKESEDLKLKGYLFLSIYDDTVKFPFSFTF
ncbi:MAG: hypothetical protein JXL97_04910 [Bacteroidales bacterium]|nr:hypothetical protein [Bacteroidales bacterium]